MMTYEYMIVGDGTHYTGDVEATSPRMAALAALATEFAEPTDRTNEDAMHEALASWVGDSATLREVLAELPSDAHVGERYECELDLGDMRFAITVWIDEAPRTELSVVPTTLKLPSASEGADDLSSVLAETLAPETIATIIALLQPKTLDIGDYRRNRLATGALTQMEWFVDKLIAVIGVDQYQRYLDELCL